MEKKPNKIRNSEKTAFHPKPEYGLNIKIPKYKYQNEAFGQPVLSVKINFRLPLVDTSVFQELP